jgi:hypothetical protein
VSGPLFSSRYRRKDGLVAHRWLRVCGILAAVALAALFALVDPRPAFACTCTPLTAKQAYDQADAVLSGTVTAETVTGSGAQARDELRFRVSRAYKGEVFAEQVVISTPDPDGCGLAATIGSTWVIFATATLPDSGDTTVEQLSTSPCSGNLPGATAPRVLGAGQPPRPGASDTEEKAVRTDATLSRVLIWGGIGLAVLAALAGTGLAVLWRPDRR